MKTQLASPLAVLAMVITYGASSAADIHPANVVRLNTTELSRLAEIMRTNHPALLAQDARVRAARHAVESVRTWSDPMLAVGGMVADGARGPMLRQEGDLIYGLEQSLPLFGKPGLEREVAEREAAVETTRTSLEFQYLRRDLAKQLFLLAFQEESLEIGNADLTWLQTMTETTEERYRAGASTQVETLRMQNERAKRRDALLTETQRRDRTRFSINRYLNRPLDTPLPSYRLPETAAPLAGYSNIVELAARNEPRVRVLSAETETREAHVAATRRSRLPDIGGYIEGRQYSGDGEFRAAAIGIKLSLPWFNGGKYRSDLARDRARVEAARFETDNAIQSTREEVHRLLLEIDAARREALLYRDEILPRSRTALESAHANWIANKGMFNDIMEARRSVLEAQLMLARAVSSQYQALAELVLYCGLADFEALESFSDIHGEVPKPSTLR